MIFAAYSNVTATPIIGFYVGGITTGLWCTFLTVAQVVHFYVAHCRVAASDPAALSEIHGEFLVLIASAAVSCFMGFSYEKTLSNAWRVVNTTLMGPNFLRAPERSSLTQMSADAILASTTSNSAHRLNKAKSACDTLLMSRPKLDHHLDGSIHRRRERDVTSATKDNLFPLNN